ncbi:MAG: hypothetical protein N3B12_03965 [Armatimonadetes bacterium]|nr:hypothetical protein [Armatimonadota bacterium]
MRRLIKSALIALIANQLVSCPCSWAATKKPVNVWRILKEHRPTVVTTEQPEKLERIWMKWSIPPLRVMPISEFATKKDSKDDLPKDGDVLFVIDRSKRDLAGPMVEQLLPLPTSAIGADEVVSYVSKTARKRSPKFTNGWEILVSSPNEKWLYDEMEHAPEVFNVEVEEEVPTKLHWFRVRPLLIVSTEGKPDWLLNWVNGNNKRVGLGDVLEPEIIECVSFDTERAGIINTLFVLNRNKLGPQGSNLLASLPEHSRRWYNSESSLRGWALERQVTKREDGSERNVIAIIAPCSRHLELILSKNPKVWEIPETFQNSELRDLSTYDELIIVPRTSSGPSSKESQSLGDFCSKLATALANGTGFRCSTRIDLKDLIYTAVEAEAAGRIPPKELATIRGQAPRATALVVAELATLEERTSYLDNDPVRLTELLPPFSEPKPSEPQKPDPEEFIPFAGKKYRIINGSRTNDPRYQEDLRKYEREKAEYPEKLRSWERKKEDYDHQRRTRDVEWEVSIDRIEEARLTGNLRIYDIRSADIASGGELVYSASIFGEARQKATWKKERVKVVGENSRPSPLQKPDPREEVSATLRSIAYENAATKVLQNLVANAVLPICTQESLAVKASKETSYENTRTYEKPDTDTTQVTFIEGKGEVVLSAAGAELTDKEREQAKQAALLIAVHYLVTEAKRTYPDFDMSEEEVRKNAEFVRDHWNKETKVYSARFRLAVKTPAK